MDATQNPSYDLHSGRLINLLQSDKLTAEDTTINGVNLDTLKSLQLKINGFRIYPISKITLVNNIIYIYYI